MAHRILFIALIASISLGWVTTPAAIAQESSKGRLSLTIAPTALPADETSHPVVYLQLQSANGDPVLASQDTRISLSSSNRVAVNVPDTANVLAGSSYVVVSLTTSAVPGSAIITAVAPDLGPVTAAVETFSPLGAEPPLHLALYASPNKMLSGSKPPGRLTIVLVGSNGRLAPATKNLDVVLTSSAPDVVRLAQRVTIPKGSSFAATDLEPGAIGTATLSAATSGFVSDSTQVQVVNPGQRAEALVLHLSPPVLPSGTGRHPGILVQATDGSGTPVYFPCAQVLLTSSSPQSVEIASLAGTACDQQVQYVEGVLDIGNIPGTANLSAVATGVRPGSGQLEIQGRTPFQLMAFLAPEKPMAAEIKPGVIVVQVQDINGTPVELHGEIPVKPLGGGDAFPDEVTIPPGRSYVNMELQGAQSIQQIDLSLVSPGLSPAHLLATFHLLPITAEIVVASEGPLFPGEQSNILARVRSGGKPLSQARLTWSAAGGTLGLSETAMETAENGEGRVVLITQYPGDILVKVTVSKAGYHETEAQATVSVVTLPESGEPSPGLFGIPVLLLFLLLSAALLGYLGYRYWPAIKLRLRIGSSDDS